MKAILIFSACIVQAFANGETQQEKYKNRISVGLDGHLRYERNIPYGFRLGTDWKYRLLVEGNQNLSLDQQPEVWFLTMSHTMKVKMIDWDNRISFFDTPVNMNGIKFNSEVRKYFSFEDRWAISPFVSTFEYTLTPDNFSNEWPNSQGHKLDFKTQLGIDLQLYF